VQERPPECILDTRTAIQLPVLKVDEIKSIVF